MYACREAVHNFPELVPLLEVAIPGITSTEDDVSCRAAVQAVESSSLWELGDVDLDNVRATRRRTGSNYK